jgi:hypothetical protein
MKEFVAGLAVTLVIGGIAIAVNNSENNVIECKNVKVIGG